MPASINSQARAPVQVGYRASVCNMVQGAHARGRSISGLPFAARKWVTIFEPFGRFPTLCILVIAAGATVAFVT
jgi:hypothetical protein